MSNPWFRFYAAALRNPKVAALSDREFRLWVNLLSVASENEGRLPAPQELKLILNARLDHLLTGLERLITIGLIDPLERGYEPHNWNKFQYKSDTSTERVRRHRAERNVSETPPDTEQKQKQKKLQEQSPVAEPAARSSTYDILLEAASSRGPCHPNLALGFSAIADLVAKGYSLEVDIVPVVREKAKPSIGAWSYFVPIIIERAQVRRAIPQKPAAPIEDWGSRLEVFYRDGTWGAWGPQPGDRGCRAPQELLARYAA